METSTTTLDVISTVHNATIVNARVEIECQREFNVSNEIYLTYGNTASSQTHGTNKEEDKAPIFPEKFGFYR